ncbi:hypothetical protein MRV_0085 [Murid herpesvirus 3]|uniref:Protein UL95 n=2 Tax=Murid betaherpesvirus 3 TaxID=2560603 RepID=A0A1P8VIW5_9BETA|nr:hypothetical protein MRV_0085 [Murine roseolovirus]APZ76296.1 hypothetical protein MRV_0085 [Murid betaherpesvirus 3]AYH64755.1 hypothetical protein MRV_0085 [Murid herpesvirus 3]
MTDTTLCTVYETVNNITDEDFSESVKTALEVCNNVSPQTKLRLIETPTNNFVLVTNVLPTDNNENNQDYKKLNISSALNNLSNSFTEKKKYKIKEFSNQGVNKVLNSETLLSGSYIIYKKHALERALSLDKSDIIDDILKYIDTPGILSHNNVCDSECLFWMLFCGPQSFCQSDDCFGYQVSKFKTAFPVLLPPFMYEKQKTYTTIFNLAEAYVHTWYKDYDVKNDKFLNDKMKERIQQLLLELKHKFMDDDINLWGTTSQMCFFCTIYKQNKLSLDCAKSNCENSLFCPIILKDCTFIHTTVAVSHVLPGSRSAFFFPIYDINKLLNALEFKEGKVTIRY